MKNSLKKLSVLVIDDEPDMLEVASFLLRRLESVDVSVASSFGQADDILSSRPIQLIVCDYHVGGKTPEAWVQELRLRGVEALFLVYTGSYEIKDQNYPPISGTLKTILKTDISGLIESVQAAKLYWAS